MPDVVLSLVFVFFGGGGGRRPLVGWTTGVSRLVLFRFGTPTLEGVVGRTIDGIGDQHRVVRIGAILSIAEVRPVLASEAIIDCVVVYFEETQNHNTVICVFRAVPRRGKNMIVFGIEFASHFVAPATIFRGKDECEKTG